MAVYDAGESRGKYTLDTAAFDRAIDAAIKRYDDLAKAAQAATQRSSLPAPRQQQQPAQNSTAARQAQQDAQAYAAQTRALAGLEAMQARLARSRGQTATATRLEEQAIDRLNQALQRGGITARETIAVERQLTTVLQQQERAAQQAAKAASARKAPSLGGVVGGLGQAAGALGIGIGVSQVVGAGVEAGQEALALRETLNTLKALTGGTEDYAHVLEVARRQQVLFGGSLRDNLEGLQGLVITARSSGAELETLINLSERLNILDPAQGTQGARIALSEALSGDPRSLALRYEIPRDALAKLTDESLNTSDRLKVLDDYLNKIGLSAGVVGERVDQDAQAFRQLAADLEGVQTDTGDKLATSLSNAATGLSRLIRAYRDDPQAIAEINALLQGKRTVDTADLEKAQQKAIANRVNTALGIGSDIEGATVRFAIEAQVGGADELNEVRQQVAALIDASPLAAGAVQELSASLLRGEIDGAAFREALNGLNAQYGLNTTAGRNWDNTLVESSDSTKGATQATGDLDEATQKLIQQYIASGTEAQNTSAATETLKNFQTDLANISDAVKNGLFTDAEAAAFLRLKYGEAADGAQDLINKQAQLALGEKRLADQRAAQEKGGGILAPGGIGFDSPGRTGTSDVDAVVQTIKQVSAEEVSVAEQTAAEKRRILRETGDYAKLIAFDQLELQKAIDKNGAGSIEAARARAELSKDQQAQATARQAALNNQIQQTGTEAQKVALAQKQYNDAVAQFGKDSAQAIDAQTELTKAQDAADAAARKGTKSTASTAKKGLSGLQQDEIDAAETTQEQLETIDRLLAAGNLTLHQRNDLEEKRRKLLAQQTDEIRNQQKAALDAAEATIDDRKARLLEEREIRGLQNQVKNERASAEERQAAALRLAEIEVDRQQRAADIEEKRRKAGEAVPDVAPDQQAALEAQRQQIEDQQRQLADARQTLPPPPIPGVSAPLPIQLPDLTKLPQLTLPPLEPPPVTLNLSITIDGQTGQIIQQQVDPGVTLHTLAQQAIAQNLMGGR